MTRLCAKLKATRESGLLWRDGFVADEGVVGVSPISQVILESRTLLRGNAVQQRPEGPKIKERCGVLRPFRKEGKSKLVFSFVRIPGVPSQSGFAASAKCSDVESRTTLGNGKLRDEIAERRNPPSVITTMEMVASKTNRHLRRISSRGSATEMCQELL